MLLPAILVGLNFLAGNVLSTTVFSPKDYWQVSPPIDFSDELNAGWKQIEVVREREVYNGVAAGRTYAHHPALLAVGTTVYLIHSSAPIDEDSMGMELWGAISRDGGHTWAPSRQILPAALLANQTDLRDKPFTYWCNAGIWQRAIGALAVLELDNTIWAVAETTNFYCWGHLGSGTKGAGRIARQISPVDSSVIGDPCWLSTTDWVNATLYNETAYGLAYGMKICDKSHELNAKLVKPDMVPAWSAWLYNNQLFADDKKTSLQEPTHAVWIKGDDGKGYWQRFWRDISATDNSLAVWVETTPDKEGKDWYPVKEEETGNKVYKTNIPDAKTKQHLGTLSNGDRFLASNPRHNDQLIRQPLTIAMSRGTDLSYKHVGVLRTGAAAVIAPDTRGYKNKGFSYPAAVQVGNALVVAYSENKENIWISIVNTNRLPGA